MGLLLQGTGYNKRYYLTRIKRSPEQKGSILVRGGGDYGLSQHSVGSVLVVHAGPEDVGESGGVV